MHLVLILMMLLLVHESWSTFDTLSICRGLNLVARHLHVELTDATARVESDTGSSTHIALADHVTLDAC